MRKHILITIVITVVFSINNLKAQDEGDALRYSFLTPYGTARYSGMGGAFGSLGADFGTLSANPGGIGLYRSNEYTFTPLLNFAATESEYTGITANDNKYNFAFGNLGFVFSNKTKRSYDDKQGIKNFQIGFGINRTADFNNRFIINGYNDKTSLLTHYVNIANYEKFTPENLHLFDTRLAYDTYLIDPVAPDSNTYTSSLYNGEVKQVKTATFSGSSNEALFSAGFNYDNRFYFGGTIGVPYFSYREKSNYTESDINNKNTSVKGFEVNDQLNEYGIGVNVKIGVIYRLADWLRLGAALHSPTFYNINRTFTRQIESDFDDGSYYQAGSPKADFNYRLQSPARYLGSAAFVFGNRGLIGIDYEFADYSLMKLRNSSDDYNFLNENQNIENIYITQNNIRIGGEIKLDPITLRAGFNYSSSPYRNGSSNERKTISAGMGFRDKSYFFDISYMHTFYDETYYLYDPYLVNPSEHSITGRALLLTVGYRF